jgi:hypothetical protein
MLRIGGRELDLDGLLSRCKLPPTSVFRKGEPVVKLQPEGRVHEESGANFTVSDGGFDEFEQQKEDAMQFLTEHQSSLEQMMAYQGVDRANLDFGIRWRDVLVQGDYFPPELLKLAGEIGLGIELSQYPPSDCDELG